MQKVKTTFKKTAVLDGLLVIETGDRIGAGACGSLLSQLGAEVVIVEPKLFENRWKWSNRAVMAAGKRSIQYSGYGDSLFHTLLEQADVILLSSDVTRVPIWNRDDSQIVCDITASGNSGPLNGIPYTDALVQSLTGIADTTGNPLEPPTMVGLPILEFSAGAYAASAVMAALRVRLGAGKGQDIDIALFDCAISALATFLPFPVSGQSVTRSGNKHSLASPWNAYSASDGWVLICTATDDHWAKLCELIEKKDLITKQGFATNPQRVANSKKVDVVVEEWTKCRSINECIELLSRIGIACGPILTVPQLKVHGNLLHRGMIARALDESDGKYVDLPGSPLKISVAAGRAAKRIPKPDGDRAALSLLSASRFKNQFENTKTLKNNSQAYSDLRVVEIGQYTTAPLVSRQLAALGAEVIKLEPPGGEGSRNWPPHQGDQGYFFTFSNSDKRSISLDLRDEADKVKFKALLKTADVLVENLKPGALAKLGFDWESLKRINRKLIYCAISGFGIKSTFPGRPAFDTVVQAMCGFMDLTRANDVPTKSGISAADIMGGEIALLSILAAITYRDRGGAGQSIDISMQDAGVWATQMEWNSASVESSTFIVKCRDGYVALDNSSEGVQLLINSLGAGNTNASVKLKSAELIEKASTFRVLGVPINNVEVLLKHPQVQERQLILYGEKNGLRWPLLNSPLRLLLTPPKVRMPIGKLGEANNEILGSLNHG
jgi:crotonobetainyl-CoA:carnitine CoA-transferase CaiB-like acyl-CoA transferase